MREKQEKEKKKKEEKEKKEKFFSLIEKNHKNIETKFSWKSRPS